MEKQTRKEKKAEEAHILAEMKAALEEAECAENGANEKENERENETQTPLEATPAKQEHVYHCRRCKTEMVNGVCPACGFKIYVPMDAKKLGKIKLVLTAVGMAIFIGIFLYLQIKNG